MKLACESCQFGPVAFFERGLGRKKIGVGLRVRKETLV